MKRLVVVSLAAFALFLAAPAAKAETADGMHPVSYNEQNAIQQLMGVLNGASYRQAERTSNQTLKEFTDWRDKMEASLQPAAPGKKPDAAKRMMPPRSNRRAY